MTFKRQYAKYHKPSPLIENTVESFAYPTKRIISEHAHRF